MLSQNENTIVEDRKNWCTEINFGVRIFGLNPKCLPVFKMHYDVLLCIPCAMPRKTLWCLR